MNKGKKYLLNTLSFIIGLFFASGMFWMNYLMILALGLLMAITLLINNELNIILFIAELLMTFIFVCSLSVAYSFDNAIAIGNSFRIVFQGFALISSIAVFGYNIYQIKNEW